VGLWGAIHKRLWEVGREPRHLDTAIRAYTRGYFIKDDYYNGINFAFLLNVRAATLEGDEAIADRVLARRIRREVLVLCDAAKKNGTLKEDDVFWVEATRVEALLGVGQVDESNALRGEIIATNPPPATWMIDTMDGQLKALAALNP
jgi:hypothetical protein